MVLLQLMKDGAVCSSVFYNLHIFLKNLKDRSSNLTAVCVWFFLNGRNHSQLY